MRNRWIAALLILFVAQSLVIALLWGKKPQPVARTPIPTLIPATLPAPPVSVQQVSFVQGPCQIAALDLIGAWVEAGKPESDSFDFTDIEGTACQASFHPDVLPLFTEPNVWFAGAIACRTCHGPDLETSAAQMDLSSYEGILAGSRRSSAKQSGESILDNTAGWEKSKLYIQIFTRQMPMGRPSDSPQKGPIVSVGQLKE